MKKAIFLKVFGSLFTAVFLLASCASAPDPQEEMIEETISEEYTVPILGLDEDLPLWVFNSTPINGHPSFVVFTTRRADREEELERTQQLAAIEAAKFKGIYISVQELTQRGNATQGFLDDIKITYQEDLAKPFFDDMELDQAIRTHEGTFARFYCSSLTTELNYNMASQTPPRWINSIPEIPGYYCAVGMAENHRNWANSFQAADENGLKELAYTLFLEVHSVADSRTSGTQNRSRTGRLETIYSTGEGIIENFLVLGRWKNSYGVYFSLIAIPK